MLENIRGLSSWKTSGTLSDKAYKCGINKISNGVELCWGISKYGSHTYVAKYNISKFVSELSDSQMIYWTLIPYDFSNSIGDVKIKIHTDSYIPNTVDVWGYGNYGGLAYVDNGAIYMDSDGRLDKNEYMTILVKFPKGTFQCTNELDNSFNYYYEMAQKGSTKYKGNVFTNILSIIIVLIKEFWFWILLSIIGIFNKKEKNKGYAKEKKRLPRNPDYYRDIPCNGNIFKVYYLGYIYGIVKNKTDLLGAIILKWIREGRVQTQKIETGTFRIKEETTIKLLNRDEQFENVKEQKLYNMLYEASGDGVLEKKEFEKWCKGKYSKILKWFDEIIDEQRDLLVQEGLIEMKPSKSIFSTTKYEVTYELTRQAAELAGLKKFLLEYTMIEEKEALQVVLLEEYLMYAQLMGIAKQVAKEFKDLYPELIEQTNYNSYDDILWVHYCSVSGISAASSAKRAAESYSSGGGGFSSGGGGGGSFGGGGGRRRLPLK